MTEEISPLIANFNFMKKTFLLAAIISLLCISSFFSNGAFAQTRRTKATGLESLRRYVGKPANDKVLKHPVLHSSLTKLIGRDTEKLIYYNTVSGPVDMVSGAVVVAGCAPHECGDKASVVVAQLDTGEVHAAILEKEEIVIYSRQKAYNSLPEGLRNWITNTVHEQFSEIGIRLRVRYR